MKVVVSCINFIRAKGLKHRKFQEFLSELESAHGDLLYYTEVRWLSRGRVLRCFYKLLPEINTFLHLKNETVPDFYAALPNDTYPNIRKHAMKMSTLFGSMYICEQTFSRMKLLKTPMRSRLTDEHLHQCLRLAVTRMEPDIQLLTSQMQAHSSHWWTYKGKFTFLTWMSPSEY